LPIGQEAADRNGATIYGSFGAWQTEGAFRYCLYGISAECGHRDSRLGARSALYQEEFASYGSNRLSPECLTIGGYGVEKLKKKKYCPNNEVIWCIAAPMANCNKIIS